MEELTKLDITEFIKKLEERWPGNKLTYDFCAALLTFLKKFMEGSNVQTSEGDINQ